jgi:CDGSH iron-sulfur domain-containing protein 3
MIIHRYLTQNTAPEFLNNVLYILIINVNLMVRYVKKEGKGPMQIKCGNDSKWICMCGLSQNQPFCDGAHKSTLNEEDGKVYRYNTDGTRSEIQI